MNFLVCPAAEILPGSVAAPHSLPSRSASVEDDEMRFNRVVRAHLADAYALALWLTRNECDAHDVVQEASIRALRGIGGFANGNPRAWMRSIVRNTACEWLRRNRPPALVYVDRLEDIEGDLAIDPDVATPEAALIRIEDETRLEVAISRLPAPYQEILVLRSVQGLSYRDIALHNGVSIGTVMSRLFRARRQLVSLMNPNGDPIFDGPAY